MFAFDQEPLGDAFMGCQDEGGSEELVLELFDVLERCPPAAREAATDAALEAVAERAPAKVSPPPGSDNSSASDEGPAFLRPSSAYDRFRDARRSVVGAQNPELSPLALNEALRRAWQELTDADRAPYVTAARGEREQFERRRAAARWGEEAPWDADRPKRPLTVFDLWSRDAKPRESVPAGSRESHVRKRITAMYNALTEDQRRPYEEAYARTSAAHAKAEKEWAEKWDLVKVYKGYVPRTDPAAVAQAERLRKQTARAAEDGVAATPLPERPAPAFAPRPSKPLSAYNAWRRENVDAARREFPNLPHAKLEKKLLGRYKALDDETRRPFEEQHRRAVVEWQKGCAAWDAEAALRPPPEPAEDDGSSSDAGEAPPPPTAYPKAPDMWARDKKEEYRAKHPTLSPPELLREMKRVWTATPLDDPVKADYRARSARLKEEYARRFEAWSLKRARGSSGPRKRRRAAEEGPVFGEAPDSVLSRAAHFTQGQRDLLDQRRALAVAAPGDADALTVGSRAHEALARTFATDLWASDPKAAARGESGPSQEILKHYYTKIANWLKRRPGPEG